MESLLLAVLLGAPGTPAALPAHAQSTATIKAISPAAQARRQRRAEFDAQLRVERQEFQKQQGAERQTFKQGLTGKPPEERKARLAEFTLKQKEKLKAFREGQAARRREFQESQKRDPAPAQ